MSKYCIGANGKVDSVKIYSQVPLNNIETVLLDYQSRTSVQLIKVLSKFFWKRNFQFKEARPGYESEIKEDVAALIIGDRTFEINGTYNYEIDLAEEWKNFTGLPFVFAAWISTTELQPHFIQQFNKALEFGVLNTDKAIQHFNHPFPAHFNQNDYLKNKIDYYLNDQKMEAMKLFLHYMNEL